MLWQSIQSIPIRFLVRRQYIPSISILAARWQVRSASAGGDAGDAWQAKIFFRQHFWCGIQVSEGKPRHTVNSWFRWSISVAWDVLNLRENLINTLKRTDICLKMMTSSISSAVTQWLSLIQLDQLTRLKQSMACFSIGWFELISWFPDVTISPWALQHFDARTLHVGQGRLLTRSSSRRISNLQSGAVWIPWPLGPSPSDQTETSDGVFLRQKSRHRKMSSF